jgi:hypothetical protein
MQDWLFSSPSQDWVAGRLDDHGRELPDMAPDMAAETNVDEQQSMTHEQQLLNQMVMLGIIPPFQPEPVRRQVPACFQVRPRDGVSSSSVLFLR